MIRRAALALAASAALAALLAACGQSGSTGAAPAQGGVVNVYSARHYDSDQAIYDAFTAKTGIQVRQLQSNADQLLQRLEAEGDATQADLIITVDGGALNRLAEAGVLQAVDTPALREAVPERMHDAENRWWAFAKRARVIAYRRDAFNAANPPPQSMNDLATPRFRGQVCARSSTNSYNLSLLAARIAREGEPAALAWARAVRANFARDPQGSDTDQLRAVAAGVCQVAIVNHYYLVRLAASADPADQAVGQAVTLSFPTDGVHVNVSGGGVGRYAPNRDNAVALLEFLVSPEAQAMFPSGNEEFPVRAGVALTPELQAVGRENFTEETVPLASLGVNQAAAARVFEQAGWR